MCQHNKYRNFQFEFHHVCNLFNLFEFRVLDALKEYSDWILWIDYLAGNQQAETLLDHNYGLGIFTDVGSVSQQQGDVSVC
jgi:hypothetical protein